MNVLRSVSMYLVGPLLLVASHGTPARAGDDDATRTQILIDLKDDTTDEDERALEALLGGIDLRMNSIHATEERFFVADIDLGNLQRLIDLAKRDPRVENAEPNYVYTIPPSPSGDAPTRSPEPELGPRSKGPNDPLWEKQWSFRMIDAPAAWEHANGEGVVVAVIDTGVAYEDHEKFRRVEDLAGTGFVTGYDFVNDDDHPNDDHGHGTHVAGTIAQTTHNGLGVAGLAYKAKIMPLKVLNRSGMGNAADIADAIRFAADEGAHVINMSLGGGARSLVMESAVAHARRKGVVVVCAAGNGSRGRVEYPAAYPGAFAVSAVGPDKRLAFYSSWGKELAMAAPGGDKQKGGDEGAVLQNTIAPDRVSLTNLYLAFQGTSMAAPHVAGAAALVMSAGVTDASKVEAILKETAEPAGASTVEPAHPWNERYGAGVLHVGRAVETASRAANGFWHFFSGMGLLALLAWRSARRSVGLARTIGFGAILGTVLGASGLWFLKGLMGGVPVLGLFATAMPTWDMSLLGASWHFTAPWVSLVPVLCVVVALFGAKKARGFLMGIAVGWAAHLLLASVLMPSDVRWVPGVAGFLDRAWLAVNGAVLFGLAGLIARANFRRG